jgi:hypothetical protein
MPDYRLIHRRALRGEKVAALTDFERGVWLAYLLIADDYGVMPFDAGELARAIWLKGKPQKAVQKALNRVRDVGLIHTWTHQGAVYCYAADWQEWQNVRHPRGTIEPCPPPEVLDRCKPKTRQLFGDHARNNAAESRDDSGTIAADSEGLRQMPRLARAGGRETLTLTANASANTEGGPGETKPPSDRVAAFIDRYREQHERYVGVAYLGNPVSDYREACTLVSAFDDAMLEALTVYWLNDGDKFASDGTRTIAKMRSRASKYAEELKAKKLA